MPCSKEVPGAKIEAQCVDLANLGTLNALRRGVCGMQRGMACCYAAFWLISVFTTLTGCLAATIRNFTSKALAFGGHIDVLVNNAGEHAWRFLIICVSVRLICFKIRSP